MNSADLFSQVLGRAPLDVVAGLRDVILANGAVSPIEAGRRVIEKDAPVTELIIPINDGLWVEGADGEAYDVPIGRFNVVAQHQLLTEEPCPYAVRSEATALVLKIPGQAFLAALRRSSGVEHYLRLRAASQSARWLEELLGERGVSRADTVRVLGKFGLVPVHLRSGEVLAERSSVWLLESGELRVSRREERDLVVHARGQGILGGECLVHPFEVACHASAATDAVLYEMPASEARELLRELNLIDLFFDESVLGGQQSRQGAPEGQGCSPLTARAADPQDVRGFAIHAELEVLPCANTPQVSANLASVANVLRLLDIRVNTSSLREGLSSLERITYLALAEVMEPYGVVARATRATIATLPRHQLPALVALSGRFCLLLLVDAHRARVTLHDPVGGFISMTLTDFSEVWDGMLLEVERVDTQAPGEAVNSVGVLDSPTGKALLAILADQKPLMVNIGLLSLFTIALAAIHPWLSQVVLDEVLTLRDARMLVVCTVGMLLSRAIHALVRWAQQVVFAEFASAFDARIGELFYRRALALPMGFFAQQRAGDILARLRELQDLRELLSFDSLQAVVQLVSVLVVGAVLAFYSVGASLLALGLGAVMVLFQLGIGGRLYQTSIECVRESTRATSLVTEQVAAVSTVKAFGAAHALRERWERVYTRSRELALRNELLTSGSTAVLNVLGAGARVGGLWLATRAALGGTATPGQVLAVSVYMSSVVDSISDITRLFGRLWSVRTSFDNVRRIFDTPPEASFKRAATTSSRPLRGRVKLEKLAFRYADDCDWVLQDINLTIYPRQVVAFVGRSGCGKTTLAHLIAGNLHATTGRIMYDGVDGVFVAQQSLRRHIGFVTQASELFQGSIADNIAFGDDAPRDAWISKVADDARVTSFAQQLPNGLSAVLGEGGTGLSGGQLQRLSIARTSYRRPSIFIFDEATSQLDAESEQAILENLGGARENHTSIIIAHRLSTVRHADVIFVMKDGRIVEEGNHEQLIARQGHYTELFSNQGASPEA